MMRLKDIRQYVAGLGIAEDSHVYIGKLDNKKEKSIGVYNRQGQGPPRQALGGERNVAYEEKKISLLVHWNKSKTETEEAAVRLFEALQDSDAGNIGDTKIYFIRLDVPEPQDVGTDDNGVYEYVIWVSFFYEKKGEKEDE